MNHAGRLAVAEETVEILERGSYTLPEGRTVDLRDRIRACVEATRLFEPEELERLEKQRSQSGSPPAQIEVRNETTLEGIARVMSDAQGTVGVLNFASARNPGGGFLRGTQAQEESLARGSALYASLRQVPEYYERHRTQRSGLYTDAAILSPGCPVFRNDAGQLLPEPLLVTFLTCAAPNRGGIAENAPRDLRLVPETLRRRAGRVLALAESHGCDTLILGAWGCGVFRNDPREVAAIFAHHLRKGGYRFRRVVFSVLDTSREQEVFRAFAEAFGEAHFPPSVAS